MTPEQIGLVGALAGCKFPKGSSQSKFVNHLIAIAREAPERPISERDIIKMMDMLAKYSAQRLQHPDNFGDREDTERDYSPLQWLAPELVRAGVVKNEAWVAISAGIASALYPSSQRVQLRAVVLSVLHPYAIDYLQQAPVIALAGPRVSRANLDTVVNRQLFINAWRPVLFKGGKLKDIMAYWKLPVQLRALRGYAFSPSHGTVLPYFLGINPSSLAQAIPSDTSGQRDWLDGLSFWVEAMENHRASWRSGRQNYFDWAITNLRDIGDLKNSVREVADFALGSHAIGISFNPRWNISQAIDAANNWHEELAKRSEEEKFFAHHGLRWDEPIPYGKLPIKKEVDGFEFVALRSGADLFQEGRAMRHCVASYSHVVVNQESRIYSIRQGEKRLATLELKKDPGSLPIQIAMKWYPTQLKGPCNAMPSAEVAEAAAKFAIDLGEPVVGQFQKPD